MWSPLAERPPRSVAPASTSSGHQSERFGGTWMPTSGISRRHSAISRFMSSSVIGEAQSGSGRHAAAPFGDPPSSQRRRAASSAISATSARSSAGAGRSSGGSPPGCGRGGRATSASASSEATRSSSVSPIPTRMPLVKGIRSSPAASIVASRLAGCLVGEPAWTVSISRSETDSSIRPCEAVTSRSRARSSAREHAEVGVGKHAPLQRPLAGPDHVGGEVLVAPRPQPLGDLRVDLGPLAGEHQQLLALRRERLVEAPLDLLGRMDVGVVGGERAVLAVALAGARERERVVAREGDPTHACASYRSGPPGPPAPTLARRRP